MDTCLNFSTGENILLCAICFLLFITMKVFNLFWKCFEIEQLTESYPTFSWKFVKDSIADSDAITDIFQKYNPDIIVNLAAQAGVRYSITNPDVYVESNLIGFYNIGNNQPENLLDFVDILQQELIRAGVLAEDYDFEAHKELVPMQPGDVPVTYADTSALECDFGFKPNTSLREGLRRIAEWYKEFYQV